MLIPDAWRLDDDGVVRPTFRGAFLGADGSWVSALLLVDSGADRTVLSAEVLDALGLPHLPPPDQLGGVGGQVTSVLVETQLRLTQDNGAFAFFRARFAAFTQPDALDMSVLGRDVTNLFALIVDRPQDVVCLVGQGHRYVIV
jgi:predicted aspartyl protease